MADLGISNALMDKLRAQQVERVARFLVFARAIVANGGNLHSVPSRKKVEKRRAANKRARAARGARAGEKS